MNKMPFYNADESFDFVAEIKPEGGNAENNVASAINILALLTIIGGLILGVILGRNPYYDKFSLALAVIYWAVGIVTGIMLMGFAEIIRLLQMNATKEYKVYCNKMVFAQDTSETKTENEKRVSGTSDKQKAAKQDVASVNPVEKEVHFTTRPTDTLVCSLCNTKQQPDRSTCCKCGARFIFDDEKL